MRIPLVFHGEPEPGDAVLIEGDAQAPPGTYTIRFNLSAQTSHPVGCACCVPRGPVAEALAGAFRDRATGKAPFFNCILVLAESPAGEAAIRAALAQDVLVMARFREG
jgi:hypothetical protein